MRFTNESTWDRATRMLTGIVLLYASIGGFVSGLAATALIVAGTLALGTGIIGYCPAYAALGLSTPKIVQAGHCPNCERE
jgi:Protein of unknown function (DUF2892)